MGPDSYQRPSLIHFIKFVCIVVLVLLVICYGIFQARNFLRGPKLTLTNDPQVVQHERSMMLTGTTKNITSLTLNGKPIFIDEEGTFNNRLVLENGYTIMTLHAKDRFGRETSLTRTFVYQPNLN